VYATEPGSAEMPSAGRAFTPELITRLVASGVQIAPLILHTGVASLEDHEPPYEEFYRVPLATARLVNAARAAGKRVIGVAGSEEKCAFARAQGADVAINYRSSDVRAAVAAATGGAGVDLILDAVARGRFPELFDHLAPLGLIVLYGALDGPAPADLMAAMRRRPGASPALRVFSIHAFDHDRDQRRRATGALLDLLAAGAITPAIHARLPLREAGAAQALLESGQVLGKLLLTP